MAPKEGWISDGRNVLHFKPARWDRWAEELEITAGEWIPGQPVPLLKRRERMSCEQASPSGCKDVSGVGNGGSAVGAATATGQVLGAALG